MYVAKCLHNLNEKGEASITCTRNKAIERFQIQPVGCVSTLSKPAQKLSKLVNWSCTCENIFKWFLQHVPPYLAVFFLPLLPGLREVEGVRSANGEHKEEENCLDLHDASRVELLKSVLTYLLTYLPTLLTHKQLREHLRTEAWFSILTTSPPVIPNKINCHCLTVL